MIFLYAFPLAKPRFRLFDLRHWINCAEKFSSLFLLRHARTFRNGARGIPKMTLRSVLFRALTFHCDLCKIAR